MKCLTYSECQELCAKLLLVHNDKGKALSLESQHREIQTETFIFPSGNYKQELIVQLIFKALYSPKGYLIWLTRLEHIIFGRWAC